jgi:rod shape-determining protein MreB
MWLKRLGIDLGTANSLVWLSGEGIVLNEPTVVAVSIRDKKVLAVGHEAKEMLGRTPGNIMATRPMRDGVIADYAVTEAMLRFFIQKVMGRRFLLKPEVMICVPAGCTQVERRAVLDATLSAGARSAYLIDEPLAAAIGANIPIAEASGNMILDIGGGAAEAAVISLGGVVVSKSVRVGGNKIDEAIADFVRRKHGLVIGDQTAEKIKMELASATLAKEVAKMEVKGRDTVTGLPREIELTSMDVTEAITRPLTQIVGMVKQVLEEIPPELSSDIIDKGIVMSGGTSQLSNLDRLMTEETGVPCHVAEDPMMCVINGTGVALENIDLYKRAITRRR